MRSSWLLITKTWWMTLTHMFMYSMAYMMLTLSMKLVISPKKTSTATWTRRKQVQWGASPKIAFLRTLSSTFCSFVNCWHWDSPFGKIFIRPTVISDLLAWWGKQPGVLLPLLQSLACLHQEHHAGSLVDPRDNLPKESLEPADSHKIMIGNRESSNFNMLLWFVNLQSIKKLLMLSRITAPGQGGGQGPILRKEILL